MEQKRIYPCVINRKDMVNYYKMLLKEGFELEIFDKHKNSDIYKYFLPVVRNYMFWSFDLNNDEEFDNQSSSIKSAIFNHYSCNILKNGSNEVVCFDTGIIFIITSDKELLERLVANESKDLMKKINLREDISYEIPDEIPHKYAYILELYKLIYLEKINYEIKDANLFDKTRNDFVKFTQNIYNIKITDNDYVCDVWREKLDLDKKYVQVENKFDLFYKNNRLNDHDKAVMICMVLLVILIIIGMINLGNWIGG